MIQLIRLIHLVFTAYQYLLVASALISWFPNARQSTIGAWITRLTEPYLQYFRGFSIGGIGFGVIIGIIALQLVERGLIGILLRIFM